MNPYEASQTVSATLAAAPKNNATSSLKLSPAVQTLATLSIGQSGIVRELAGSDNISARLLEMGMIPGTTITLIGKAPLGDPLEFELRGYRLSLRKTEAQRVAITVQD